MPGSNSEARKRNLLYPVTTKAPVLVVSPEGEITIEPPELSWEQRARIAEDKLQSLMDGLASEEAFYHMVWHNPLVATIIHMADRLLP